MAAPGIQLQAEPGTAPAARWSLATRIAFRFCFIYFGLYCLLTQISTSLVPLPNVDIPDPSTFPPMHQIVTWTAVHLFGVTKPLVYFSGSGDKIFDWVLLFVMVVFTAIATAIWSIVDRRRENYISMHKWFRLVIRICLAGQMFAYGWAKAVPLQMPFPYLTKLVEPYGNFSHMGVLWASIGASPAYEIFAGCAEMLGGLLLIVPRTTTLGALVCLADMTQVFMLNMTYDVPVKLLSFHLILLSLFLLAPDLQRLANIFFLNRAAGPSMQPPLFRSARSNRIAVAVQVLIGIWLMGMNAYGSWSGWHMYGGGRTKSALYGIWDVDQMTIDGQVRSPLLSDYGRWRRVVFDFPTLASFQRMDDSFARYGVKIDVNSNGLVLTKSDAKDWKANLAFQRPTPDQLILDGQMDGHKVRMQLRLFDREKFLLISRGFHWVQENPFNR
ncbi:MAG: DoxX family protein [Candidatus Korobacteraceae bacterium]